MSTIDNSGQPAAPPNRRAEPIRLLLVDDHDLFRESLSRLLRDESDLYVVGQCSSVEEARLLLSENQIDLILLDFDLGKQTGFELLKVLRVQGFLGRVLFVTAGISETDTVRAINEGAFGVFLKHRPPSELVQAIHQVMLGESWLDGATIKVLNDSLRRTSSFPSPVDRSSGVPALTARERDVLRGVFAGLANKEIASQLQTSEGSVKGVLQQLFAKAGVRSRAQLVRIALENRYEYELDPG